MTDRARVEKLLGAVKKYGRHERRCRNLRLYADECDCGLLQVIAQTEAEIAGESAPTSPINACIRAAKRVLAALNLPEGAGVAFDPRGWRTFLVKPEGGVTIWLPATLGYSLPDTAIPPWPGDWRDSWITRDTPEVES